MTKIELNNVLEIFKGININDSDIEDFVGELRDKAELLFEKGNDDKADEYDEIADTLESLVESYQALYEFLEDKDLLEV